MEFSACTMWLTVRIDQKGANGLKTEKIRVSIETNSWTIVGTVHAPISAYRSRLSDLLNQREANFLAVTDAAVYHSDNLTEPAYSTHFMSVNLHSIEIVRPLEE
jgi:hypothetical protein